MARLTIAARKKLPRSDFVVPSKGSGAGSYPIPDKKHLASALGFAAMHHPGDHALIARIRAKGRQKFGLGSLKKMKHNVESY